MTRSSEAAIHKAILAYLRLRFPRGLVVHAANELNIHADAKSKAIAQSRAKALGMMPGWPDLMLLTGDGSGVPGTGEMVAFEVKAEGGRLSDNQRAVLERLRVLGFRAAVVRSVRDVEDCLAEWGVDGVSAWQSIGNVAGRLQEGLRHSAGDDKKKSGGPGASNTPTRLTITDLDEGGQDGC